jgi:LPS sulfotransferase NodH
MENRFHHFRKFILKIQRIFGNTQILKSIEHAYIQRAPAEFVPPIFIIGAPRTGSTLLYQLLIQRFHLAFFTNLQSFFYGSPAIIARLTQKLTKSRSLTYPVESKYGYISGALAPSEAGAIFRCWFGEDDITKSDFADRKALSRKTIACLSVIESTAFLAKNLYNSIRLATISSVFPEAFFIWIKRDPLYVGQSLLMMRRRLYGSDHIWASVKPYAWEKLVKYSPFEQVVRQIKGIEDYILQTLTLSGKIGYVQINYQRLCRNPREILDNIAESYRDRTGFELLQKNNLDTLSLVPEDKQRISDADWQLLSDAVERIYKVV